nr:hypothetical protein [Actinomyces faecalis]
MSEHSEVGRPEQSDGAAPRRSRRAIRQAEREAEREALLTGQQPLLTRRELRRLRQEAEALRAAVDAGEITLEQAKALQDPLAKQPDIDVPQLSATGSHAAVQDAAAASQETPDDEAEASPQSQPAPWTTTGPDTAEKEALAAFATGVLPAADRPDAAPAAASPAEVEPASVPQRRSVMDRATQQAETSAATVSYGHATDAATAQPSAASSAPDEAGTQATADALGPEETVTPSPSQTAPSTPTRRPIVRIPSSVQGVRTVDASTGELSAVQVMDEGFHAIETPQWKAFRQDETVQTQAESVTASTTEAAGPHHSHRAGASGTDSWASAPQADWAEVPGAREAEDQGEDRPGHSLARHLLIALLVLVVVLVAGTLLWFYLGRSTTAAASSLESLATLTPLTFLAS